MTAILSILCLIDAKEHQPEEITEQVEQVLHKHQIHHYDTEDGETTFCIDGVFFMPTSQVSQNTKHYSLLASMKYVQRICTISFFLTDQKNQIVRAENPYQRISLIRLCFLLNSFSEFFHIKANPLTGELCFCRTFLCTKPNVLQYLDETLKALKTVRKLFQLTIQFLQKVTGDDNKFLKYVESRLCFDESKLKPEEKDQRSEQIKQNFTQHSSYFFVEKNSLEQFIPPISLLKNEFQNKDLTTGSKLVTSKMVYEQAQIGRTNLSCIALREPIDLKTFKEKNTQATIDSESERMTIITNNLQKMDIKVMLDVPEDVFLEYRKCDKIVSRKLYLNFLKQYVQFKHQNNVKEFIFYLPEESMSLRMFLNKNLITMSVATRVKLSFDIALICMVCNDILNNFNIKIDIDNLLVCKGLVLKIDRLNLKSNNMELDTSKAILRILFGNSIALLDRNMKARSTFMESSESSSLIGPSTFATLLRKPLLDMMMGMDAGKVKCPSKRANLLIILQSFNQFYEKDQDIKAIWKVIKEVSF